VLALAAPGAAVVPGTPRAAAASAGSAGSAGSAERARPAVGSTVPASDAAWVPPLDRTLDALLRMGMDGIFSDHVPRMVEALARNAAARGLVLD